MDGALKIDLKHDTFSAELFGPENLLLTSNEWNFVAMTFNGNKDQSALFINEGHGGSLNVVSRDYPSSSRVSQTD